MNNFSQAQNSDAKELSQQAFRHDQALRRLAVERVLEEERARHKLAVAMHDELGQSLAIAKIKLNAMESKTCQCNTRPEIKEVADLIGKINESIGLLCFQMSPLILYELGLVAAIEWLADEMRNNYGFKVDVQHNGNPNPLEETANILLFCSVRRLLDIMVKHSNLERIGVVLLREGSALLIKVIYHGLGFANLDHKNLTDFNLDRVRDKMIYLGGTLQFGSLPDSGRTIILMVPLDNKIPLQ